MWRLACKPHVQLAAPSSYTSVVCIEDTVRTPVSLNVSGIVRIRVIIRHSPSCANQHSNLTGLIERGLFALDMRATDTRSASAEKGDFSPLSVP